MIPTCNMNIYIYVFKTATQTSIKNATVALYRRNAKRQTTRKTRSAKMLTSTITNDQGDFRCTLFCRGLFLIAQSGQGLQS